MRNPRLHLLLLPLLALGTACADRPSIVAPEEALFSSSPAAEDLSYEVIALDGGNGSAWAINDAGIAVGTAREGGGETPYPALRWRVSSSGSTGPEDLGSLPPPFDNAYVHHPEAINNSGVVVGYFNHNNWHGAFIYSDASGMQVLPRFVGSTYRFYAHGVNDAGIAVGFIEYAVRDEDGAIIDRRSRAAVWVNADDEPILLPPLADHIGSFAYTINNDGLILGTSWAEGSGRGGVFWRINEGGELVEGPDVIEEGFFPSAVNNGGDIAGSYPASCESALMRGGVAIVLGPLTTGACPVIRGMSDAAPDGTVWIVGSSSDRPILWTVSAQGQVAGPVDLGGERGNRGAYPTGVNAHGWVVGGGRTPRGDIPLLWLPKQSGGDDGGDAPICTHPRGKCK